MANPTENDPFESSRMTLGEHLAELRTRLVRGVLAVLVLFLVAYGFGDQLAVILWKPHRDAVRMINADRLADAIEDVRADPSLDPADYFVDPAAPDDQKVLLPDRPITVKLTTTGPGEAFLFKLKSALYVALFGGSPVLLWELWGFVAAGLYANERRMVTRYFPLSLSLFVGGVVFCYFAMMPYAMYFLGTVADPDWVQPQYRVAEYGGMLFSLSLSMGAVFQLPVLMLVLARLGLVEPATFARYRSHFIVGAFFVAAILTPPDPFTQTLMGVPMVLLYELGILIAKLAARPRAVPEASAGQEAA